jgi:hypothetical protein
MSARSYLLLEELQLHQDDKSEADLALFASHGGTTNSDRSASHGIPPALVVPAHAGGSSDCDTNGSRNFRTKKKDCGRNGGSNSTGCGGSQHPLLRGWAHKTLGLHLSRPRACPFACLVPASWAPGCRSRPN